MNGILGSYNLYSNIVQSVARCGTDNYSSITLNLCNRSALETCYVDIAVTLQENVIDNNSRYVEYNARIASKSSFSKTGILVSEGEFVTLVYRGEDPRCLTATAWGIESGEDQDLAAITLLRDPAPVIITTSLPNAEDGTLYSQQIVATDNREIASYALTAGALPTGLSLNTTTGVILGTPSGTNQDYTFTVRVTDNTDEHTDQELTITKTPDTTGPVFETQQQDLDREGFSALEEIDFAITAVDPSTPITYSLQSGVLPTGLSFNSDGTITGTAEQGTEDTYSITVRATDAAGNTTDADFDFVLARGVPDYQAFTLTADSGVSITGNGTDSIDIVKTSGSNGWNRQAYTVQGYTAPITMEFNTGAGSSDNSVSYKMIGWNTDPTTDNSYTSIDHAAFPYQQNQYVVYNNGSNTNHAAWSQSQKFYLVFTEDNRIKHYNGSTLLYDAAYAPGQDVHVDTSMYSQNSGDGAIRNLRIRAAIWNGTEYE